MDELCVVLWGLVIGCAGAAGALLSWLLQNWPWFQQWYGPLPNAAKTILFVAPSAAIGAGLGALGAFVLPCRGWPAYAEILALVALAIISSLSGSLRYAVSQRNAARNGCGCGCG